MCSHFLSQIIFPGTLHDYSEREGEKKNNSVSFSRGIEHECADSKAAAGPDLSASGPLD